MTVLEIKLLPDPILRKKASPLEKVSEEVKTILNNMAETMYNAPGIGLAGNQVGVLKRLVVMDCSTDEEDPNLIKMINPEIVNSSDEKEELEEGCLSIPDHKSIVKRPANVKVKYLNIDGIEQTLDAEGLLAACVQHEIDHLNGILFVDHISRIKRDMILRKIKKKLRENEK
jgi:peptide deformylase